MNAHKESNRMRREEYEDHPGYFISSAEDPYALVTGGSSGIGKAIARELARLHYNLLLIALPDTGVEEVAQEIRDEFQVHADALACDLTEQDGPQRVFDWCQVHHYPVNILANNAGMGYLGDFESMPKKNIQYIMALNNGALVLLTHLFLPELTRHPKAYILNVGSLASFEPMPNKAVYAATKSFVYSFSAALRMELEDVGISVSCLCPNGVVTNGILKKRLDSMPISKHFLIDPETVARKAVYCMLNGQFRIIPGWQNRFVYRLEQVLPEPVVHFLMKRLFSPAVIPKSPETETVHAEPVTEPG
jgi:uncharacterized protein